MSVRCFVSIGAAVLALTSVPAFAQGQAAAQKPVASANAAVPKTPWGDPDLQGAWTNATITPLQRPAKWAGRESLRPDEAQAFTSEVTNRPDVRGDTPQSDFTAYNAFWWDRGMSDGRTALITEPKDGKIPPLSEEGQRRKAMADKAKEKEDVPDTWTDLDVYTRCIVRSGLPRVSTGYNNNYQIVQSPGLVAIMQEQMNETRVIPLDGRPHLDQTVRQWLGDSRGHWEGDTLVVETTNFSDATLGSDSPAASGKNLHLVERWRRSAADRLEYSFTVTDPTMWTMPWSAAWTWTPSEPLYEYACHEDNRGMEGILKSARAADNK